MGFNKIDCRRCASEALTFLPYSIKATLNNIIREINTPYIKQND